MGKKHVTAVAISILLLCGADAQPGASAPLCNKNDTRNRQKMVFQCDFFEWKNATCRDGMGPPFRAFIYQYVSTPNGKYGHLTITYDSGSQIDSSNCSNNGPDTCDVSSMGSDLLIRESSGFHLIPRVDNCAAAKALISKSPTVLDAWCLDLPPHD